MKILKVIRCIKINGLDAVIPTILSNDTMLRVFDFMKTHIDKNVVNEHLRHNQKIWNEYAFRKEAMGQNNENIMYIEKQNSNCMKAMRYGIEIKVITKKLFGNDGITAKGNACEIIASYNALTALNDGASPVNFPWLLSEFELDAACLYGNFGTAPSKMEEYFNNKGYTAKLFSGENITSDKVKSIEKEYETYVITSYNNKLKISEGIHTFSITKNTQGRFVRHNDFSNNVVKYDTLEEAIKQYNGGISKMISVMGIKKLNVNS